MGTYMTAPDGTGGELQYSPPYKVQGHIHLYVSKFDARLFAIRPTGDASDIRAGIEKREIAFDGYFKR